MYSRIELTCFEKKKKQKQKKTKKKNNNNNNKKKQNKKTNKQNFYYFYTYFTSATSWENLFLPYRATKAQISLRIKSLASFSCWAGRFESYLVADPEDRFPRRGSLKFSNIVFASLLMWDPCISS